MLGMLLLWLTGCGVDAGGSLPDYDTGGAGNVESGGSSSAERGLASESTGGSASSGSYCPACTECPSAAGPKCVVGAQTACACTDGSSGAQICQDDGTMGECVCEAPAGSFPECYGVGFLMRVACDSAHEYVYINCQSNKRPDVCVAMEPTANVDGFGGLCCSELI